jgi:hypothetical protein
MPSDGGKWEIGRPLTEAERLAIEAREDALARAIAPFPDQQKEDVNAVISAMYSGFRSMRDSGDDIEMRLLIITNVLRDFPYWAIESGCLAVVQRRVQDIDRRFPPNDAQLYDIVDNIVRYYRANLQTLRGIMGAVAQAPRAPLTPLPMLPPPPPWTADRAAAVAKDLNDRRLRNQQAEE